MLGHVRRAGWATTPVDSAVNLRRFELYATGLQRSDVAALLEEVCIFLHRPFFSVPVVVQGLEVVEVPCVESNCNRCLSGRGGFRFNWVHPAWTSAGAVEALEGRSLPCAEQERELSWEELVPVDTSACPASHACLGDVDSVRWGLAQSPDGARSACKDRTPRGPVCYNVKHGQDMFSYLHAMPVKSSSPIVCPAFSGRLRIEVQPPGAVGKPACAEPWRLICCLASTVLVVLLCPPRVSAATAIRLPAAPGPSDEVESAAWSTKVAEWRRLHEMEDDGDFAFCFTDADQARAHGPWLLFHWVEVRSMLDLAQASARVFEVQHDEAWAPPRAPLPRRKVSDPQTIKVKPGQLEARNRAHVEQLMGILIRAYSTSKVLTALEYQEQAASFRRWAEQLVKASEPATIHRALCTWDELIAFLHESQRRFSDLQSAAVEAFIHNHKAPGRAFTSLKWLAKNFHLQIPADHVLPPPAVRPRSTLGEGSRQAAVLEMVFPWSKRLPLVTNRGTRPGLGCWVTGCR